MKSVILATLAALAASQNILADLEDQVREGRSLERDDGSLRQLGKRSKGKGSRSNSKGSKSRSRSSRKGKRCRVIAEASAILLPADPVINGLNTIEPALPSTSGQATFEQFGGSRGCDCGPEIEHCRGTCVRASVWGLTAGPHGFHVHEAGVDLTNGVDCGATGSHYNPDGVDHALPSEREDEERHIGAIGNIISAGPNTFSTFYYCSSAMTLLGDDERDGVLDRAVTIHAGED